MGGEGGVNRGDHVVLVLLVHVFVLNSVRVSRLHAAHMGLHGKERAVHRHLLVVWNVHAAKVCAGVSAVHDMAVGEDVGEGAFLAKLAVSLDAWLARHNLGAGRAQAGRRAYLCEVLARRPLRQRLIRVQERAGLPSLAGALPVEFTGYV